MKIKNDTIATRNPNKYSWHGASDDKNYAYIAGSGLFTNHYLVYIYDQSEDDGKAVIGFLKVPSKIQFPPVFDRQHSGIDYYDYLEVMKQLNIHQDINSLPKFPVNKNKAGKFIHTVEQSNEEIEELLKNGGRYRIRAFRAEDEDELNKAIKHEIKEEDTNIVEITWLSHKRAKIETASEDANLRVANFGASAQVIFDTTKHDQ